jgi:hypothetical protein
MKGGEGRRVRKRKERVCGVVSRSASRSGSGVAGAMGDESVRKDLIDKSLEEVRRLGTAREAQAGGEVWEARVVGRMHTLSSPFAAPLTRR